jgi:hypothetical protein
MTGINNITTAGLNAIVQSAASGYQMQLSVTRFKLGSLNTPFDQNATDVPGQIVYTGQSPALQAMPTPDPNTILYVVTLGYDVGTFKFGSVGLYLADGTLLTYISLNNIMTKVGNNLPGTAGNYLTYYIPVQIVRSSDSFEITASPISYSALPRVSTFSAVPAAVISPFNCYAVSADETLGGRPSIVFNDGQTWYHLSGITGNATSKFATTIFGDGNTTNLTVQHNLSTTDIVGTVYPIINQQDSSNKNPVATYGGDKLGYLNRADVLPLNPQSASINFQQPPAVGTAYRVVIVG